MMVAGSVSRVPSALVAVVRPPGRAGLAPASGRSWPAVSVAVVRPRGRAGLAPASAAVQMRDGSPEALR